jgi:hypothetical protein
VFAPLRRERLKRWNDCGRMTQVVISTSIGGNVLVNMEHAKYR